MSCAHVDQLPAEVKPDPSDGCRECLDAGQRNWVHLRICLSCGHVGCCDSSPGKHATEHYNEVGHPVMQSFEKGEDWRWCYPDAQSV